MNVHAVLRECATDLLDTEEHVTVEQVVGCAYRRHGDTFAEASERLVLAAAKTIVAKLMRDLASDENDQQQFEGMAGLPSAIAVQTSDGTYYVRADKATWPELEAGRSLRAENVTAAQQKLDAYDEAMDSLRAVMESDHAVTVADALRRIGQAAA